MTVSASPFCTMLLVIAVVASNGCLPSAPRDEEKEPHFLAGRSRVNTMDYKGAIESFEKALEVNPKSGLAHFELGWLYDQKEPDPAAAIYHYERYLKLCPNSGKEEMVKTRILACKQQLAQAVSLAPGLEKQQREMEQLAEENKRLRDELEKWRSYAVRAQTQTNPMGSPLPPTRRVEAAGSAASAVAGSGTVATVRTSTTATPTLRTHTVKAGETMSLIARKYGVKLDALLAANPRLDARRLPVGQALTIPPP